MYEQAPKCSTGKVDKETMMFGCIARTGSEMLNRKVTLKRLMFGCMPARAAKCELTFTRNIGGLNK